MARMPTAASCVFCCLMAATAYAQPEPISAAPPPPANLAFIDGSVDVAHDSVVEPANPPVILLDGDAVRAASGRAEIVFADGTLLHLDRNSNLEILSAERVRLLGGSAIARVSAAASRAYFVDTPIASVRLDGRGEYTVSAVNRAGNALEVSVARGSAEIDDGAQRVVVRGGESVSLAASGARAIFRTFNTARWDSFAQWSSERANGFATTQSAAQLPAELRPYSSDFDENGRWDDVAPYGSVWFPAVAVGWRPYYDGSWGYTRYGWTWYGRNRWAWPTHHFGRWGWNGASWFWIPTNVWGPGWVGWGFSAGHVSWSPLGFDGRPTMGFWRRDQPGSISSRPGLGWTVVPRGQFGPRLPIRANAIDGDRLDDLSRRALVFGPNAPPGPRTARPYVNGARTFSTTAPRMPARADAPTYDRSGPVRPSALPTSGAPANFANPRNRAEPVSRPPDVQYIRGSMSSWSPVGTPPPAIRQDGGERRLSTGTDAGADRPNVVTRPDRDATGDDRRGAGYSSGSRGAYERRGANESDRSGNTAQGGSVRSRAGERAPAENSSGARESGGRQGGGTSAGAPAPGSRGGGGGGGQRGGGDGGGRGSGGGRGGAVGRPR